MRTSKVKAGVGGTKTNYKTHTPSVSAKGTEQQIEAATASTVAAKNTNKVRKTRGKNTNAKKASKKETKAPVTANVTPTIPQVTGKKRGRPAAAPKVAEIVKTKLEPSQFEGVKRRATGFWINPLEIQVNFDDKSTHANPRKEYGEKGTFNRKGELIPGEWDLFKASIRSAGNLEQNIKIYKGSDDKFHLRHGFRRMKAVLELIEEGFPITHVPVDVVEDNNIEAMKDHFRMNNGKPLNDVELADGLRRYGKLRGEKNVRILADELNMDYVKATQLMKFIKNVHPNIVKSVNSGEMTFTMAKNIVNTATNTEEQLEMLEAGREEMKKSNGKKIRIYNIDKVKATKTSWFNKIFDVLDDAATSKRLDIDFVNRTREFITAVKEGKSESELEALLAPVHAIAS